MEATLYKIGSEPLKLNKVFDAALPINILLKEDTDILRPQIELAYFDDFAGYNYIYIPSFNRYYFTGQPIVTLGARIIYNCTVDPLMSWKNGIKNLKVIVDRSNYNNPLLHDILKIQANENILYRNFEGCEMLSTISGDSYCIVLSTF